MRNNIACMLKIRNQTVDEIAIKLGIDVKLIKYYIENPCEEVHLEVARKLANEFQVPMKFLLGYPCKYKLSKPRYKDQEEDLRSANQTIKPYLKFHYYEGYYYEAGFAKGLGKQVIICCRKQKFDRAKDHFDINQINHILWQDLEDLKKQLIQRIQDTVI